MKTQKIHRNYTLVIRLAVQNTDKYYRIKILKINKFYYKNQIIFVKSSKNKFLLRYFINM